MSSIPLDNKDMEILRILSRNSRITYVDIAKRLGLSDVAVIKRIRRLEQLGVIRKYTIRIDVKKLGYGVISITGIDVDPEYLFNIVNELKDKEYVRYLAITSGDHALMTVILAKDSSELSKLHQEISFMRGVKRVCPAIVLDVVKELTLI